MLDLIRKKKKSLIIKVVFYLIIGAFVGTIFLVWGKGSDKAQSDGNVAVTINGSQVSYDDYQTSYSNLYNLYRSVYKEQFTPALEKQLNLRQQALDSLIDQTLLLEEGKRLGIRVSKQELVDSIAAIDAFKENGVFNKERYVQVLSYQRLTTDAFEAMQERQLFVDKVRELLQEEVSIDDDDIDAEYHRRNDKIDLNVVKFAPPLFESKVDVDDEALQSYFEEHKEEYRLSEKIALDYLVFDPANGRDAVTLDDAELEKYYRRHLDAYEVKEQVKASHILIKAEAESSDEVKEEKRAFAEKLLVDLDEGADFAELARKHSDDPGSASRGGELGFFTRGTMVAPFEEAAFTLKPGELSGVVETSYGFHIIRADEYVEAGIKKLADVINAVKEGARADKSKQLAFEKAMDLYNINRKGGSLAAAADAGGLSVEQTPLFTRGEAIPGFGLLPDVSGVAFSLDVGELTRPVQVEKGVLLYTVREKQPSRIPDFADVRGAVEEAYRQQQSRLLAEEAAQELLSKLASDVSIEDGIKGLKLEIEETGLFSRGYGDFIPGVGSSQELAEAAFALTAEQPILSGAIGVDDKFIVATLKEQEIADPASIDASERESLRESLLGQRKQEYLDEKLKQLRDAAQIVISASLQSSLEGDF